MTDYPRPFASEHEPRTDARPRTDLGNHSLQFWLTVLGLGCISLMAMMWGASNALATKGSEKLLRIGLLLPKLKNNHGDRKADAFRMSEPETSELAHPKERETPAPPPPEGAREVAAVIDHPRVTIEAPVPRHPTERSETAEPPPVAASEPGLHLIPRVESTPASQPSPPTETKAVACPDPVVYLQPCTSQRGDSPMMRNWKTLTMYSLLTTASVVFVPQPILAGGDKTPIKVEGVDELKKTLEELVKRVGALESKKLSKAEEDALAEIFRTELRKLENGAIADLKKSMERDVASLQTELLKQKALLDAYKLQIDDLNKKVLAGGAGSPAVDKAFMEELRGSIKALNETIAKFGPTDKRLSMSPPNATTTTGRVVIVNLYAEDLLFIINGTPHRVPALTTFPLDNIPVGTLRYEVVANRWGTVQSRSVSLAAGETYTLTASHPR